MSLSIKLSGNRDRAMELISEAKRRLSSLKGSMSFQSLKQLYPATKFLSDGSSIRVGSVFGMDFVTVNGVGVDIKVIANKVKQETNYIFLIQLSLYWEVEYVSYAVWEIKENGILKPINFNISEFVGVVEMNEDLFPWPATIKSNQASNFHRLMVLDSRLTPPISFPKYGALYTSFGNDGLFGLISSFRPTNTGPETWEENYIASGLCSGRNPWYLEGEDIITKLELYDVGEDYQIKCLKNPERENETVWGSILPITSINNVNAILSKDKYIGYEKTVSVKPHVDSSYVTTREVSHETFFYTCINCTLCGAPYYDYRGYYSDLRPVYFNIGYGNYKLWNLNYPFLFGEVVLEVPGSTGTTTTMSSPTTYYNCVDETVGASPCGIPPEEVESYYTIPSHLDEVFYGLDFSSDTNSSSSQSLILLDYDNDNFDIDQTFICIYNLLSVSYTRSMGTLITSKSGSFNASVNTISGSRTAAILSYRINGGELNKVELATYWVGTRSIGLKGINSSCFSYDIFSSSTPENGGGRVKNISCKIHKDYIIYSHILETLITGGDWYDDKRILGIINRKTGKHTTHEISNDIEFALDFNKFYHYGIGIHTKVQEVNA